jgi:aminobenzoyl-glutamate utilization protein B
MLFAAKALALTALDLLTKPDLLQAAQTEFATSTAGRAYVSPIPEGTVPH